MRKDFSEWMSDRQGALKSMRGREALNSGAKDAVRRALLSESVPNRIDERSRGEDESDVAGRTPTRRD